MRCFHPITIKNPCYGKVVGYMEFDFRRYIDVPCGKCPACLRRRRDGWIFRLEQELYHSKSAVFLTLTYDDQNLPFNADGVPSVCKRDVQLFFKRLRKNFKLSGLKYFLTSEYGSRTERPHYHCLLFNFPASISNDQIAQTWSFGFTSVGTVTGASIGYVAKYFVTPQSDIPPFADKPFSLISKGIGLSYLDQDHVDYHRDNPSLLYCVSFGGFRVSIPRYYRDKMPFDLVPALVDDGLLDQRILAKFARYDWLSTIRLYNSFISSKTQIFNLKSKNQKL